MKQLSAAQSVGRLSVGLIIFSLVFSACNSYTSNTNSSGSYKTSETRDAAYSQPNSNMVMSNSASMNSPFVPMFGKNADFEEKQTLSLIHI